MEGVVNILGVLTALTCSVLLYGSFRRTRARLLWWGSVCFLALSLENAILFVDLFIFPDIELYVIRYCVAAIGIGSLIFGLIWEAP